MPSSSIAVTALVVGLVTIMPAQEARAFCFRQFFGFHCSGEGHDGITEQALDFLSSGVVALIVEKNADEDQGQASGVPHRHATNCSFGRSAEYINLRYSEAIAALDPNSPNSSVGAATHWGLSLHGIQDFYSHSAWVDPPPLGLGFGSGNARLLESGLGAWQVPAPYERLFPDDDVVLVEGLPPAGVSIDLPRDAGGNPTSAVPIVTIGGATFRGLMTASASPLGFGAGQCPENDFSLPGAPDGGDCTDADSVCIRHGETDCEGALFENCFHHDNPDHPRWLQAFNSAVVQTEHEWCRLLHSAEGGTGDYSRASIPMALWVARDQPLATPHPLGSACARDAGGPIEVEVKVVSLVGTPFGGSTNPFLRYHMSLVAYTGDFRQSSRQSVSDFVGNEPELPADGMTLCLKPSDTLVTTVWGFTEPNVLGVPVGNPGEYDPTLSDVAVRGVTRSFTAAEEFGAGTDPGTAVRHHASSADLGDVAFEISRLPGVDTDGDGLSRCGEASSGTDPSNPDTDGDGLLDGAEVNVHGTNPLSSDSDGDGLSDSTEIQGANPTNPLDPDSDDDGLLDGVEDANQNGAVDLGETNPNDADADDDLLTDGCEANGTNATNPLVPDGDGDGLLDGVEDANQNCALDGGETDPNDADSDDDELNDGIEVAHGTDPLDPDSDDDGIPDGEDVEWIQQAIEDLPAVVFGGNGHRVALLAQLDTIERHVVKGQQKIALSKLEQLRSHVDGCGALPGKGDWIVDCPAQLEVRGFLDLLASNLGS